MKNLLKSPITLLELESAMKSMALGKSPGPDGLILEFYRTYWSLIGVDFWNMIMSSINQGQMPKGVTKGMIALLHKRGDWKALTNWQPITLLNINYKIYAKALQLRLQPILMEIISPEQSAFLPLRFILDNLLLTQETMAWAEHSREPSLFLKLDFAKAYGMLELGFLFKAMEVMGFPLEFIIMVKLLFSNASVVVKVNGALSPQRGGESIERGVRQGCPLAPYLFIILADVLNIAVQTEACAGRIKGISLPFEHRQQILAQYADDTSFTLLGEEESVRSLIYLLETFCLASGLVINWHKSSGHWKFKDSLFRPPWTNLLGIKWADEEEVSKLLGAPFGLSLATEDVDKFLYDKIVTKLNYWGTQKINPTDRAEVVNSVLLSTLFFFLSIWGGSGEGLKKIKGLITNYLAAGTMQRARSRVGWLQCCQPRAKGGLNLINLEDAAIALMTKWAIKAMEPGMSNLHLFLRYRLSKCQPYPQGGWNPSLEYFPLTKHQCQRGSIVWNKVTSAWKRILPEINHIRPNNMDEFLSCSIWHFPLLPLIGP